MRRSIAILSALLAPTLVHGLCACQSDTAGDTLRDAATVAPGARDSAAPPDASGTGDGSRADGGSEAAGPAVTVLATFDESMGQLPEGLWEISPDAVGFVGTTGTPITAWAPVGAPVTVGAGGSPAAFGSLGSGGATSTLTLGVTTDGAGRVYYAVAAYPGKSAPYEPAPGVYVLPSGGGGTAKVFSLGSAAKPAMNFANGLDFDGATLRVADSEGVIYAIDGSGKASVWSDDPLLAPSTSACGGKVPLPIGANGIVHDASNVYVTNTDAGRLIKIPIQADGSAGTAAVLREDCATLVGADGLLIDPQDGSFIVAVNALDQIVRVAPDGSAVTVLASGKPLATPASPLLDTAGGHRRLLVTSTAFFTPPDAGAPNLAQLLLP